MLREVPVTVRCIQVQYYAATRELTRAVRSRRGRRVRGRGKESPREGWGDDYYGNNLTVGWL